MTPPAMMVRRPDEGQTAAALDLIVHHQGHPSTACSYLGTERDGIVAELEDLTPPWRDTLHVAVGGDGQVVGAALVDWSLESGRSWIHGPWMRDADAWSIAARPLIEALIGLTPETVSDHEICAAPAHRELGALAADLGWPASEVSIAYVAQGADGWPSEPSEEYGVQPATSDHLPVLSALHELAFPSTYATAPELLNDSERITLVLEVAGSVVGYASGEVQPDGAGYLDYLAIHPDHRGRGLSRLLLAAIGRRILAASPQGNVNLTVQESNAPAVALYESFGFTRDAELVAYRLKRP